MQLHGYLPCPWHRLMLMVYVCGQYVDMYTDPSMNLGIQTAKSYFSNGKLIALYFNGKTQIGVCKNGLVL